MTAPHSKPGDVAEAGDEPSTLTGDGPASCTPLDQRMTMFDGDDLVVELVEELVSLSMLCAEASYVERRLTAYAARHVADQLFTLVQTCEPTLVHGGDVVSKPIILTTLRRREEPPQSAIDATCRLAIRSKEPPARPTPPSTPRKSKRLLVTASLAASSMLSNNPSAGSLSSPRSPFAKTPAAKAPAGSPVPGVPYSTAPPSGPPESPRKSVALFKTAMRLASAPASRPSGTVAPPAVMDEDAVEDSDRSTDCSSDNLEGAIRNPNRGSLKGATLSPTATTLSSNAWSITLPGDPSTREDARAPSASVDVEFVVPPQRLPLVGRRQSSAVAAPTVSPENCRTSRDVSLSIPLSSDILQRRGTFLQLAEESEAVEVDPMGMLGFELREHLSLSPGVKLQAETGEFVKSGPQLPEMPTRMRRSTFVDESLAIASLAAVALTQSTRTVSPTRPAGRPSTTVSIAEDSSRPPRADDTALRSPCASNNSSGVFTLTECASATTKRGYHHHHGHNESTRSLAISHAGSVASSSSTSTTSVKSNLFRKPAKVVRPCTAASQCCGSGGGSHAASTSTAPADTNAAFADLVKQRAFQRKPSVLNTTSPPKKMQSRRSVITNTAAASSAASRTYR